jgi:hypothetical protein
MSDIWKCHKLHMCDDVDLGESLFEDILWGRIYTSHVGDIKLCGYEFTAKNVIHLYAFRCRMLQEIAGTGSGEFWKKQSDFRMRNI